MKKLSVPYQMMLFSAIILAVFYPTLFAEISLVDDLEAIQSLLNTDRFSLVDIFFPRSAGGGYYRPLIGVSYWLDKHFWFLHEHLMHFEGVVGHLLNGLLVFFVCRESVSLCCEEQRNSSYLPLTAAFLFSLHPVVTESVNWISGRTDIMMGNFVLLSVFLAIRYKKSGSVPLLLLALVSAMIALLAKEAAFGYLMGVPLLLFYQNKEYIESDKPKEGCNSLILFLAYYAVAFLAALFTRSFWAVLLVALLYFGHSLRRTIIMRSPKSLPLYIRQRCWLLLGTLAGSAGLFVIFRSLAYTSSVNKIGQTIKLMGSDLNYTITLFLGATGFYVKKFFMPLPLNFFIHEIDPLYDFVGIAVLLLVLRLLISRSLPSIMTLIGFFLVLPALPFAFGSIAWTSYAERYIYLSSAFWVMALCLWTGQWLHKRPAFMPSATIMTAVLVFLAAGVTYVRNRVWQTNTALMQDTVLQNPTNRMLRDMYMYALLQAGRIEDAKREYRIASSLRSLQYDDRADLVMGDQLRKEGRYAEALKLYENALQRAKFKSEALLDAALQTVHSLKKDNSLAPSEHRRLDALELEYTNRLMKVTKNPQRLIEVGRYAIKTGSFSEAVVLFDSALRNMPKEDRLRAMAERLREKARNSSK